MKNYEIKDLIFDVFGTVVDWRKTLTKNVNNFLPKALSNSDLEIFAHEWRKGYSDYISDFNDNKTDWKNVDEIHKDKLIEILNSFNLLDSMDESSINKLNRIWHQLEPWEDSVEGLDL